MTHIASAEQNFEFLEIMAPDGRPFIYPKEEYQEKYVRDVLEGRDYPQRYLDFYSPSTIIDIGAHAGSATRMFAALYPEARIICYEPNPFTFKFLNKNCGDLPQVTLVNAGLGTKTEKLKLYAGIHSTMQASTIPNDENKLDEYFEIDVLEVMEALREQNIKVISILKIDTEGLEVPILNAMKDWLPKINILHFEYHSEADRLEIEEMIKPYMVLYHAEIMEPDRGTMSFIRYALLEEIRTKCEIERYAFPKNHS